MDIEVLLALQNLREALGGTFNTFFAFITTIAVDYWVILPAMIIFWAVDKKKGQILLFSAGIGRYLTALLKTLFCVYRPWIRDSRVKPLKEVMSGATGYSFPSGHSASTSSLYAALIVVYRKYKGLCVFCAVMILVTMFSRMYVGVHTPQDVLVGAAIGFAAAFAGLKIVEWVDKHPDKDWVVLAVTIVVMAATLVLIALKKYPMDYVDGELLVDPKKMTVDGFKDPGVFYGIVIGWFLERRYVKFDVSGTTQQKLMRALVGGLLTVFWYTAVAEPIGNAADTGVVHFITQASTSKN